MQPNTNGQTNLLSLSPTMLIGLGGSGKDVLLRVRRLFYERMGLRNNRLGYPIVGYLALDTDASALHRIEGEALSDFVYRNIRFNRGGNVESIQCSIQPNEFNQYFDGAAQEYPHIFSWLSPDMRRFGPTSIVNGAGQNRPFGRLAFFHHFSRIKTALANQIKTILDYARDPNLLAQWLPPGARVDRDRLEIVLVYSLAGGTGAGMFLDAGMLAREVVRELPVPVQPHFTHFAVLPEPFIQDAREHQTGAVSQPMLVEKIQANAFAALREMEYFAMRQSEARFELSIPPLVEDGRDPPPLYTVEWDQGSPVRVQDCPWDTCYLLGGRNDLMGPGTLPTREIYQMIAEHLFLDFDPNQFGDQKRTLRPNLTQQTLAAIGIEVRDGKRTLYKRYVSRRFSTFGLSQLYFDRERMRRAAGHRLAALMVQHWWLRNRDMAQPEAVQAALSDLAGGGTAAGETPRPLTFDALLDGVLQTTDGTTRKSWWDLVGQKHKELRFAVEDGKFDPATGEARIKDWVKEHENWLQTTKATSGEAGMAPRGMNDERVRLEEDVEKRLRVLFRQRLKAGGVNGCLHIFKEYTAATQKQVELVKAVQQSKVRKPTEWEERLREAMRLPFYAKTVATQELLRGLGQVRSYLMESYRHAAAPSVGKLLAVVQHRFDAAGPRGSYYGALARFQRALEGEGGQGVLDHLNTRFKTLREEDLGARRTHGLLSRWNAEEYDQKIREQLFPSARADEPWDWEEVEQRVLARLRELPETDRWHWQRVESLADLVLSMCDPNDPRPAPSTDVEEFARLLAEACESLLGKFASDSTALREFQMKADQRANLLQQLRVHSAPYLSRKQLAQQEEKYDVKLDIFLGMSNYNTSADARTFATSLTQGAGTADGLAGMKPFNMDDDAIVLYQEKAGIPLSYYSGLDGLGRVYEHYAHIPETHLDFVHLRDRLPEVRWVDPQRHKRLADCVENTLYALMTGVVQWEAQRVGDPPRRVFKFRMGIQRGAGLANIFVLGTQVEEVARFLADAKNEEARSQLQRRVEQWMDDAIDGTGEKLIALWCGLQLFDEEVRRRIQTLIDREKLAAAGAPDTGEHPLRGILSRMLDFVQKKLEGIVGSRQWLESPLSWKWVHNRMSSADGEDQERVWRQWKRLVDGCLEVIDEKELPIPVIRSMVRLKHSELTVEGIRELPPPSERVLTDKG